MFGGGCVASLLLAVVSRCRVFVGFNLLVSDVVVLLSLFDVA